MRQRGVALITAVVLVAIATVLAARVGTDAALDLRRTAGIGALNQGWHVALGAEAWAAQILSEDQRESQVDDLSEAWAQPVPLLPIDGGSIEGSVEDMQGRFNLNNLIQPDGSIDEANLERFRRLLRLGYVVVSQPLFLERMKKLVRCTINGVNSVAQYGAAAALNGPQEFTREMAREYETRRDILFSALERAPYVQPFKPGGAFYLWARIQPDWPGYGGQRDDWSMTNYLIDRAGIGSSPGSAFGAAGAGHIRFAFSCSTAQVEEAARLLPSTLQAVNSS